LNWEIVMGLEVHAELSAKSKLFCSCTTAFGGEPNTHVCPVCSGMPGTLPRLNRAVVEYAVLTGLALNCEIAQSCKFDRKHYFYPDLPKAFQVSQLYSPICCNGHMEIESDGVKKTINIRQIHMEEDAGKLIHDARTGSTLMDFNRSCVPLLEIVSQPDFRTAGEVISYLEKLRETLLYLGVCDCKMQEGSIRADVNLSVRKPGGHLGVRTEMKNLNSFKAVARAIEYESERQINILESGGQITQETRRWDDDKGISSGMRSKENAQDYRYFPEPDLLPVCIDDAWLRQIKASFPELAHQKRERYVKEHGVSAAQASLLTSHKNISDLFDAISDKSNCPLESASLITGEIMRLMNSTDTLPEDLSADADKLSVLVMLLSEGKINRNAYKKTVGAVFVHGVDPESYIAEKGLLMVSDDSAVTHAVESAIAENPGAVDDWYAGKEKALGFLMGQVMKKMRGTGNPEVVKKILKKMLDK